MVKSRTFLNFSRFFEIFIDGIHDVGFGVEAGCVIGASDERAGGDVPESFVSGDLFVTGEIIRVDESDDRQVIFRRAEILSHGEDGDTVSEKIVHGFENFVFGFSETEHDAAFGGDFAVNHFLGSLQDAQGAAVLGTEADEGREAFDGFQVVPEDVRTGIHHGAQGRFLFVEIGGEHFDDRRWAGFTDGSDDIGEVGCGSIGQIVARDHSDHGVLELHMDDGIGDMGGFFRIQGQGLGCFGSTEAAGACTTISGDHESSCFLAPAFVPVRAVGFFTDGEELFTFNQVFDIPELLATG